MLTQFENRLYTDVNTGYGSIYYKLTMELQKGTSSLIIDTFHETCSVLLTFSENYKNGSPKVKTMDLI